MNNNTAHRVSTKPPIYNNVAQIHCKHMYIQYHNKTHETQHNKTCNTAYKQLIQNQTIEEPDSATTTAFARD